MSNVSIYGKNWIDLVFEGRNKSYGAYQLRQENEKTTTAAFFFALVFLSFVFGIAILFSSFGSKPAIAIPIEDGPTIVTTYHLPEHKPKKAISTTAAPPKKTAEKALTNPVIVAASASPDIIKTNAENNPNEDSAAVATAEGTNTETTGINAPATGASAIPAMPDEKPVIAVTLDVMPEFPGGIKKFYDFVGRNFERPEVELSRKINVLMYFVIEKDGSMTDIKVLQNPGYGLDKEAIRVLKSIRSKWRPGIKNGQPVRTAYTLPIAVQPL